MAEPIRVLYVDDDPTSLCARGERLAEHDRIEVVTETNVQSGLARLDEGRIDCVLSDLEMPGRDGIDFLEMVRTDQPHLPFILFSGTQSPEAVDRSFAADATDYVPKSLCSISYRLLTNRVVNAVEHYRARERLQNEAQNV